MHQPKEQNGVSVTQTALLEESIVREIGRYTAELDNAKPDSHGVIQISVCKRPQTDEMLFRILSFLVTGHLAPITGTTKAVQSTFADLIALYKASGDLKILRLQHAVVARMVVFLQGDWLNTVGTSSNEVEKGLSCSIVLYEFSLRSGIPVLERAVLKQIKGFQALTAEQFIDVAFDYLGSSFGAHSSSLGKHFKYRLKELLPAMGQISEPYRNKVKQGALRDFYLELLEERMMESLTEEQRHAVARGANAEVKNEDEV